MQAPVAPAELGRDLAVEGRPSAGGEQPAASHVKLAREMLGAGSRQEDMGKAAHHLPRQGDDVLVAVNGADRTGLERASVHQAGVQLDLSQDVRQPAVSDTVIGGVGLHAANGRLDGVEGAAPGPKDPHPVRESDSGILASDEQHVRSLQPAR